MESTKPGNFLRARDVNRAVPQTRTRRHIAEALICDQVIFVAELLSTLVPSTLSKSAVDFQLSYRPKFFTAGT